MDIKAFEKHLNIEENGYKKPSIEALNYYLKQFMMHVPFENISVQNNVRISLKIEDLYDKIVHQKRGGYCYELNTLFSYYLKEKGFHVEILSATVHTPNGGRSQDGSHMTSVVTLNANKYIVDVGFGNLPLSAMQITSPKNDATETSGNDTFRAVFLEGTTIHVQKWEGAEWKTRYETTLEPRSLEYFKENIEYNQTNPNSIFVKNLLITMPKSFGRATMSEDALTLTKKDSKEKIEVTSQNYRELLKEYFDLDIVINRLEA